jgi:hypothetical protein
LIVAVGLDHRQNQTFVREPVSAKKYEGRIRQEVERVYNKIAEDEAGATSRAVASWIAAIGIMMLTFELARHRLPMQPH